MLDLSGNLQNDPHNGSNGVKFIWIDTLKINL